MHLPEQIVLTATGSMIVALTAVSMVAVLVIPRGNIGPIFRAVDRGVNAAFRAVSRSFEFEIRDRILAGEAAVIILVLLAVWLGLFVIGYSLILWPIEPNFGSAIRNGASSMFTLGFTLRAGKSPAAVDFVAAATGMIAIALQIGYLPTLYSAYNRRETEVTLLGLRAGRPPWGPELLTRSAMFDTTADLPALFASWERWAADVTESHSSYPLLLRFRSPKYHNSWVISLLAVLDSASMYMALAPSRSPMQVRLCLRSGFLCFRQLASTVGIRVDNDPLPTDPIQLSFEEFAFAYEKIERGGFEIERELDEAWRHFQGWRVNYESSAYGLASALDVVPAVWSGPRRIPQEGMFPLPVPQRTPDDVGRRP